jgi:hypothetical protein
MLEERITERNKTNEEQHSIEDKRKMMKETDAGEILT